MFRLRPPHSISNLDDDTFLDYGYLFLLALSLFLLVSKELNYYSRFRLFKSTSALGADEFLIWLYLLPISLFMSTISVLVCIGANYYPDELTC